MPNDNSTGPPLLLMAPNNKEPSIGPVQENETMANVKAIKKIPPILPMPERELVLLAIPPGSVISKYPKKEIANTIKTTKKKMFNHTLVEILFSTCGDALKR
jgi:hypothetical protein